MRHAQDLVLIIIPWREIALYQILPYRLRLMLGVVREVIPRIIRCHSLVPFRKNRSGVMAYVVRRLLSH